MEVILLTELYWGGVSSGNWNQWTWSS